MKKTAITITCLVAFALSTLPLFAADGCCPGMAPASKGTMTKCPMMTKKVASKAVASKKPTAPKKVVSAVCPVMGNKIPNVTKAAGKSVYKGKTYYFCCSGCKPLFDKNPAKYIRKK